MFNCFQPIEKSTSSPEEVDKKRLLDLKVDLDNGGLGYVFTVSGAQWKCHVCDMIFMGIKNLLFHERSMNHSALMQASKHHASQFTKMEMKGAYTLPIPVSEFYLIFTGHECPQLNFLSLSLLPHLEGEPAPPGVDEEEDIGSPVLTNIQATLDDHKSSPLIGLEYVVELNDDYEKESAYVCMLCDKKGDPRTVMAHLVSYNHRLKYLVRSTLLF